MTVQPMSPPSSRRDWTITLPIALVLLAVALASGFAVPMVIASSLMLSLALQAIIEAIFATSVGVLLKQNGRISFGQAGFYGAAAYIAALIVQRDIASPELAIIAALAIPTALAFVLGLLIVKIPGIAFAMVTLAIGQALYEVAYKWRLVTNGDDGLAFSLPDTVFFLDSDIFLSPASMFVICWCVFVLVLFGYAWLSKSPFGQLTEAIRDNPERAQFIGYDITVPRALVYAFAAFVAACAGVLFSLYNGFVSPSIVHWSFSGAGLIMAIIGGPRLIWGPALGAIIYFWIKEIAGDYSDAWPAFVGAILIAVTLLIPNGFGGLIVALVERARRRR
ncbi:MAG: branched-chain amino acid ABC transporter permease [Rhizobiaceae bacterium]